MNVVIVPANKMDTPRGLWRGQCIEGLCDYSTGVTSAGNASRSLIAHWEAKHNRVCMIPDCGCTGYAHA